MSSTTSQPLAPVVVSHVPARRVWRGAVIAAATATAAIDLYAAAIRALGAPMKAGFLGAATASPLTAASFATGVLVCTFWGAVLAAILAKTAQPGRLLMIITAAPTAVSLAVPAGAAATAAASAVSGAVRHRSS